MVAVGIRCPRCGSSCASDSETPDQYLCSRCDIGFSFHKHASGRTTMKTWTVVKGAEIVAKKAPVWQSARQIPKKMGRAVAVLHKEPEPRSVYERVQKQLQGKNRDELLERFGKLRKFLVQDDGNALRIFADALPDHFLKYYSVRRERSCTYKEFFVGDLDSLLREMTDSELVAAIAQIESDLRINTDMEIRKAFAQTKKQFTGRQKGRAYKSYHEH